MNEATAKQRFQELRRKLKRSETEKDEALQALQETMNELQELKGDGKVAPADLAKENAALKKQVRETKDADAWKAAAAKAGVNPEKLADLRKLLDYKDEGAEPDVKAITKALRDGLKDRDWAKAEGASGEDEEGETTATTPPAPAKEPPLSKGEGADRGKGGRGPAGFFTVRRSDLGKPAWMRDNQSRYVEAQRAGTLHITD